MKRLYSTLIIIEFALRAIVLLWQEPKTSVTWKRLGKQLKFSINIDNHLFNDEIKKRIICSITLKKKFDFPVLRNDDFELEAGLPSWLVFCGKASLE